MNRKMRIFNTVLLIGSLIFFIITAINASRISDIVQANKLVADKVCQLVVEGEYFSDASYSGPLECYKKVL